MTHLIINLIAFALSAFALWLAVFVNRKLMKQNKKLLKQNKELLKQLKAHEQYCHEQQSLAEMTNNLANTCERYVNLCYNETKDGYVFKIADWKDRCAVIKATVDETTSCIIKEFNDPDQDYNHLCAEELVEKLNEK